MIFINNNNSNNNNAYIFCLYQTDWLFSSIPIYQPCPTNSCPSCFALEFVLGFVTQFQYPFLCAYPCHLLFSLASKGEQSLTINVLIFIKFDFNWNNNWNMLLLVIYIAIHMPLSVSVHLWQLTPLSVIYIVDICLFLSLFYFLICYHSASSLLV